MRRISPIPLLALCSLVWHGCEAATTGTLEVVSNAGPCIVFAGEARTIPVVLRNQGPAAVEIVLTTRLYQTSSATAAMLTDRPWKNITVLPGETILESCRINFPIVRAETPFLIQWIEGTNRVIGETKVLVYPTNLLEQLKPLLAGEPLGIFDPNNTLKPLLRQVGVDIIDLETHNFANFTGRLALVGPFTSRTQMREGLKHDVRALAERGAGVVWVQAPPEPHDKLRPSFYTVPTGKGAVVVAQADILSNPAENPAAQLNLIYFAQLALKPETIELPETTSGP